MILMKSSFVTPFYFNFYSIYEDVFHYTETVNRISRLAIISNIFLPVELIKSPGQRL